MNYSGPAFPGFNYVSDNVHDGMTLRDYFAGQALAGCSLGVSGMTGQNVAALMYEIADAMLAERNK